MGAGLRGGGDSGVAGMPAYTMDYAGNYWAGGHLHRHLQPARCNPTLTYVFERHLSACQWFHDIKLHPRSRSVSSAVLLCIATCVIHAV